MKKHFYILIFAILLLGLGCGCSGKKEEMEEAVVVKEEDMTEEVKEDAMDITDAKEEELPEDNGGIDYDLSVMGSDMVYATVYQMMTNPQNYEGKTFKVSGTYASTYYEDTDTTYHFVIIKDAMACCSQGLEFIYEEGYEYPLPDSEICITGTFETYTEDGNLYCHLIGVNPF